MAAHPEWVCALLDCWKGEDGAWMRTRIQRLTALPRPPRARKAHPLDGLVTWGSKWKKEEDDSKLGDSFQFRASSIHRRVTRGLHDSVRRMCVNYTPAHVDNVVTWFRENSAQPKPNETAEEIKTAFKNHFGCMSPDCDHTCTSFDVDHVNCGMKAAKYGNLIKKGAQVGYRCISQLNPCCRSNSSAIIYQYKKDAIWAEARLLSQHWWKSEENPLEEAKKQKIAPK